MNRNRLIEYAADASIIAIALIWGSTFIVMKKGIEDFEPVTFIFCRFAMAALLMLAASIPFYRALSLKLVKDGVVLGVYLFLTFFFQVLALEVSTATEVGFLTGLYVLFVPILSALFFKKIPHLFSVIGVLISAVGMGLITFESGFHITYGQFLAVLNAFFIGLYILQVDVYARRHNVVLLTAVQILTSAVLAGIYSFFFESQPLSAALAPDILYPLLYLAFFATVVCFFVQTAMQKYTTPTKAAIMFTFEPLSSAFFSFFLGGELLGVRQYTGAGLIIVAILVAEVGTAVKHAAQKS